MTTYNNSTKPWCNFFEKIDFFGIPISFHIHEKTKYRTSFSGFLSFTIVFILVAYVTTTLFNALYYQNIQYISTIAFSADPIYPLDSTNFVMAARIEDPNYDPNNALYTVVFQHVTVRPSGQGDIQSLGTVQCTKDYMSIHASEISTLDLSTMYCPGNTVYPIAANGSQYIQFQVKKCENITGSIITCASQEEIDAFFNDTRLNRAFRVSLYITYHFLDMLSDTPNVHYLKKLSLMVPGAILARQKDFYIREEIVTAEANILNYFKKGIHANNSFTMETAVEDQTIYADEGSYLEVNFKKSDFARRYSRSFAQIGEILVSLGGITQVLMVAFSVLAIPYNKFHYNLAISNEIYEFESRPKLYYKKTSKSPDRKRTNKKGFTFADLGSSNVGELSPVSRNNLEPTNLWLVHREKVQQYHPFFESLMKRHNKLRYSIKEKIKSALFWCKGRNADIKNDLYTQARQSLRKDIDIITLLKKLQDVDKLKQLILNQNQMTLFNYKRPRRVEYLGHFKRLHQFPMINKRAKDLSSSSAKPTSDPSMKDYLFMQERPLEDIDQFKGLFEAYKASREGTKKLDTKLVEMLGPELLSIFEKLDEDYQNEIAVLTQKSVNNIKSVVKLDSETQIGFGVPQMRSSSMLLKPIKPVGKKDFGKLHTEEQNSSQVTIDFVKKPSSLRDVDVLAEDGNSGAESILLRDTPNSRKVSQDVKEDEKEKDSRERIAKVPISLEFMKMK